MSKEAQSPRHGIRSPFEDVGKYLNYKHPSLKGLEGVADIRNFRLRGISPDAFGKLQSAVEVYEEHTPRLFRRLAHYQAAIITPKEEEQRPHRLGVIMLSGVKDTAVGNAHIAAEFYKDGLRQIDHNGEKVELGFSAVLSSSGSRDTFNPLHIHSNLQRAAEEAAVIVELLKRNPVSELRIVGHSLGTFDALHMIPILERLLQEHNIDTKISMLILFNPLGQVNKSPTYYMGQNGRIVRSLEREINEALQLDPNLNELSPTDRLELMKRVLQGADKRRPELPIKTLLYLLYMGLYMKKNWGTLTTDQIPEWVRDKNHLPTAMVLGEEDPYMNDVLPALISESPLYKNVPVFDVATVRKGSHSGIRAYPSRYSAIFYDIGNKLLEENERLRVALGASEQRINLHQY